MPLPAVQRHGHAEKSSLSQAPAHLGDHLFRALSGKFSPRQQPVVIVVRIHPGILQHKAAASLNDVGEHQRLVLVQ